MSARVQMEGRVIGLWTVLSPAGMTRDGKFLWLARCQCGTETVVRGLHLRNGHSRSCGCLRKEGYAFKHGMSESREYWIYQKMMDRCTRPSMQPTFSHYGGRGISVCQRWMDSFEAFFSDMGSCPPGLSLDRINNDGNYEPNNCRWATRIMQARNKTTTRWITVDGVTASLAEWAEKSGLSRSTIGMRLHKGCTPKCAVFSLPRPPTKHQCAV